MNVNARTEPLGIVPGLSIEDYHAGPGVSCTGLKTILRSPAHYFGLHEDPRRPKEEDKAGQQHGRLAHCAILEPDEFQKRYRVVPKDAPRSPTQAQWGAKNPSAESLRAMDWWREFTAGLNGAEIISAEQYETAMRQAESAHRLPEAHELLSVGAAEVSAYWRDDETGILCRCRPDFVNTAGSGVVLLDVKTCSDASPDDFRRHVARKGYHVQDAWYSDGYEAASGQEVAGFVFLAVEDRWPFAASLVMLDDDAKETGRVLYREALNTYAQCKRIGVWPGYGPGVQLVSLPAWALRNQDVEVSYV